MSTMRYLKIVSIGCLLGTSASLVASSASQVGQEYAQPTDLGVTLGIYPSGGNPGTVSGSGNASSGVIGQADSVSDPTTPFAATGRISLSNPGTRGQNQENWAFVRAKVTCLNIVHVNGYDVAIVAGTIDKLVDNKGSTPGGQTGIGTPIYSVFRMDNKNLGSYIYPPFSPAGQAVLDQLNAQNPNDKCNIANASFILADLPGEFGVAPQTLDVWGGLITNVGDTKITP